MTGTVRDGVVKWLHGQGFGLEYAVAAAFRSGGFGAGQGQIYLDRDTSKLREIDVLAVPSLASTRAHPDGWHAPLVYVVVECKRTDAAWVVLTANDRVLRDHVWTPIATPSILTFLERHPAILKACLPPDWPTPFKVLQTGKREPEGNPAFAACSQVVSACLGSIDSADAEQLAYPVVVIDAPLFAVSYLPNGDEQVAEVPAARVLWSGGHTLRAATQLDVVTAGEIANHAKRLRGELGDLFESLEDMPGK